MTGSGESEEEISRKEDQRQVITPFPSSPRSRRRESLSSQIRRIAIGGFPDDPEAAAKLHPLLRFFRLEEEVERLKSSGKERADIRKPKPPHVKMAWTRYFHMAQLTSRQGQCAFLKYDEGLSPSQIGRRLRLDRKAVYEHLQRAATKMNRSKALRDLLRSKVDPHK